MFSSEETNKLGVKAQESMDKNTAKELVDISMKYQGDDEESLEAQITGLLAVYFECATERQLQELALYLIMISLPVIAEHE